MTYFSSLTVYQKIKININTGQEDQPNWEGQMLRDVINNSLDRIINLSWLPISKIPNCYKL